MVFVPQPAECTESALSWDHSLDNNTEMFEIKLFCTVIEMTVQKSWKYKLFCTVIEITMQKV